MPPARKPAKTPIEGPRAPLAGALAAAPARPRAAPPGPHRPRAGRRRRLPRLPAVAALGRGAGGPGDRRRAHLAASARVALGDAGGARGRRRPARPAARCCPRACGPSVPARCASSRRAPGPGGGHVRPRAGDARRCAGAAGTPGQLMAERLHAPVLRGRRAHHRDLPVRRRLLLLTGATVAGVLRATGEQVAETTRALRPPAAPRRGRARRRRRCCRPSPRTTSPSSRHASRVDGALRYPDLFEAAVGPRPPARSDEPEPPRPEPGARARARGRRPPTSRRRRPEPSDAEGRTATRRGRVPRCPTRASSSARPPSRPSPTPPARRRPPRGWWRRSATSACRRRSSARWPARTSPATSCSSRPGVKMAKVANLKNDLAYALAATEIRILAPIPGKRAVGVEVPNRHRRIVTLGDVFCEPPADSRRSPCGWARTSRARRSPPTWRRCPTCSWRAPPARASRAPSTRCSSSILLRATPDEVRLVLVDPKQVELNHYEAIPHLLTPVITSPRMAANALQNLVREMEWRYGVCRSSAPARWSSSTSCACARAAKPLPYILCVIDELADLMMVAPADVEDSIIRLAQKARAVGIHLVLATQSPRVDVITGMIKANVPSRIAFAVSSQTDSRVILDQNGAESLLGQGDMLFSPVGTSRLQRIQGAYIDEPQIEALTSFWARQGEPELREDLLEEVESEARRGRPSDDGFDPDEDPLLGRRDPARRRDGHRVDVDAPAPPAPGLHARRAAHRHARAPRRSSPATRAPSRARCSSPRATCRASSPRSRAPASATGPTRASRRRCPPTSPASVPPGAWRRTDRPPVAFAARSCRTSVPPSARRACAPASTSRRSSPRRRSARSTCARWRTRSGTCSGADVRQELPAHLCRRARASTASCSSRSTSSATSASATSSCSRSRRRGAASAAASGAASRAGP